MTGLSVAASRARKKLFGEHAGRKRGILFIAGRVGTDRLGFMLLLGPVSFLAFAGENGQALADLRERTRKPGERGENWRR
jgi:hypothetical protein